MNIFNSDSFVVEKITKDKIILDYKGVSKVEIAITDFNKYFYLGFCITIHASQGETYIDKYTIHDWEFISNKLEDSSSIKYVALSRGTCKNNIQIK